MDIQRNTQPWLSTVSGELIRDVSGFICFLQGNIHNFKISSSEKSLLGTQLIKLLRWREAANQVLLLESIDNFELHGSRFEISRVGNDNVIIIPCSVNQNLEEKSIENECFRLTSCLRAVRTNFERREIFKAEKCSVDSSCDSVESFVVKRVAKTKVSEEFNEKLRREFKVQRFLTRLDHPGLNKLYSFHEDDNWMVGVSYSAGNYDLVEFMQKSVGIVSESDCAKMFKTAVEGLLVAHNFGIAHRDISLENLVFSEKSRALQVIDWGLCTSTKTGSVKFNGVIGKERYFAPELVFRTDFPDFEHEDVYDPFKADVFSLGVCLYSVLLGRMPFAKVTDSSADCLRDSVLKLLRSQNLENHISQAAKHLLEICLKWDPEERASLDEVLSHSFFLI